MKFSVECLFLCCYYGGQNKMAANHPKVFRATWVAHLRAGVKEGLFYRPQLNDFMWKEGFIVMYTLTVCRMLGGIQFSLSSPSVRHPDSPQWSNRTWGGAHSTAVKVIYNSASLYTAAPKCTQLPVGSIHLVWADDVETSPLFRSEFRLKRAAWHTDAATPVTFYRPECGN